MWEDSEDLPADVRASVQQALHTIRETLQPYLLKFDEEQMAALRLAAETPGPRAVPLPAADSDLGHLHAQLQQMSRQMAPHRFLDDLHAELTEMLLTLEGTLIVLGARAHDIEPAVQQGIRMIIAN